MANQQIPERDCASWAGLRGKTLRYVLLRHSLEARNVHYDLMLELRPGGGSSARTLWGLQRTDLPRHGARRLEWRTHRMHRRRYLTSEGHIGQNRGSVKRIDKGHYCVVQIGRYLTLEISGKLLSGRFRLLRSGYGQHVWVRATSPQHLRRSR